MALRFEPSRFFLSLPLRKNLLCLKRKAINIYFALYYISFKLVSSLQQLILYLLLKSLFITVQGVADVLMHFTFCIDYFA